MHVDWSRGLCMLFFCKYKTEYEMRIMDWSSDVCSSDLIGEGPFAMMFVREVGAFEEIGNPADAALRQCHAQVGIALPEFGEGPVGRRIGDRDRHRGDPRVDRAFA